MVTTGGRVTSFDSSSSVQRTSLPVGSASSATSGATTSSSSSVTSIPSSPATSDAVSKSIVWLIVAMTPMFTSARMMSTTDRSSDFASSPTCIVFGRTTGRPPSGMTATAVCATGAGAMGGPCGRERRRGRGPRCGGKRRGLAFGICYLLWVAPAASSSRSRCWVVSSTVTSSARASEPSVRPRARHASSGHRYAPRPGASPRRSTESPPLGPLTTRISSRFGLVRRHATQVRCGTLLTPIPLLLTAEERAVFLLQLVFVGRQRLRLDLRDEVVTDRLLVLFHHRCRLFGGDDRLRLGLRLGLGPHLRFAADVDPPPGELRREAGVLALLADRERQVAVRHDHVRGLLLGDDVDADHR